MEDKKKSPLERLISWWQGLNRRQRRNWGVLMALILSVAVVWIGVRSWIRMPEVPQKPPTSQQTGSQPDPSSPQTPVGDRKEGVYTFLVAGKDVASGSTDVMLLLSFDTKAKTIYGLNLPRDTMINTDNNGKRLNAVYAYNRGRDKESQTQLGMTALKEEVERQTGIYPDFHLFVEWEAVGNLVDAIGGVEFEVPFLMDYEDPYQDLYIYQEPGLRTLTGEDAMEVVRWRKNSDGSHSQGDVGRLAIQQDFLKAVVKKCLQPAIILKLDDLVDIFKENVETDLTVGNILAFAEKAIGMDPETGVTFETAPLAADFRYNGAALVSLDGPALVEIVNERISPYHREITLEDLEIIVYEGNGRFSVTSGTLAPSIANYVPPAPKPEPEPEPKPEPEPLPEEEEVIPGEGEEVIPGEGEETIPGEGEEVTPGEGEEVTPGEGETEPQLPGQPEPILPLPGEEPLPEESPEIPAEEPEGETTEEVPLLPPQPEAVEPAA